MKTYEINIPQTLLLSAIGSLTSIFVYKKTIEIGERYLEKKWAKEDEIAV